MYIPIGLSFSIHRYLSPCHVHEIMNRSFGPQRFTAIRARNPGARFTRSLCWAGDTHVPGSPGGFWSWTDATG